MKISDFLSPAHVMITMRARDKSRLLEQLSTQAAGEVGLVRDDVVTEIAKREELGSTGVGSGVALPHARLRALNTPFGLLARLHHGSDFNAIDGEPVDIVFFCSFRRQAMARAEMHEPTKKSLAPQAPPFRPRAINSMPFAKRLEWTGASVRESRSPTGERKSFPFSR